MSEESTPEKPPICPSCGEPVEDDAPAGLCPKCVLGEAAQPTGSGDDTIPHPRFDAPEIEEIARAFPTLEIIEVIGCGGMGAVYKARQPHLDREVALKILPHSLAETAEFTERFTREGRLLARLNHPNIVGVYDFGDSGGYFFLLMEFVDGVNLRQAMAAGKFSPDQALEIVPEVCEALQFAHNEGILHRDIKPENILLDTRGRVKIADFGIAKMIGEVGAPTITRTAAPGTPQYMAPEQIEQPAEVDHRADIYSLGVVFYEMLTGELPIGRFAAPSEKTTVGSDVDEIVFRSLEKERDRRQQSADEVRTQISGVPVGSISSEMNRADAEPEKPDPRIRPGLALTMVVAGCLFPLLILWLGAAVSEFEASKHNWELRPNNAVFNRVNNLPYHTQRKLMAAEAELTVGDPEIGRLQNELNIVTLQKDRFQEINNRRGGPKWSTIPAMIALWAFIPLCAIPTTIFGWRQLWRLKASRRKSGRIPSLIAAWIWPMGVIVTLIWLIVFIMVNGYADFRTVILIILLSIAAGCWSVFKIWKWLVQPPTAEQRERFLLQDGGESNEPPPILNRYLLLGVILIGGITLILVLASAFVFEGRERASLLLPCAILAGIATLIATGCFAKLVNGSYRPVEVSAENPHGNSWPRRIFWMIALVILVPVALIMISLAVPNIATQASADAQYLRGTYGVGIGAVENSGDYHAIDLTTVMREISPKKMKVRVRYEGPGNSLQFEGLGNRLHPGNVIEWTLEAGDTAEHRIEFLVPDESVREEMFAQLAQFKERAGPTVLIPDIRRLDLFDVEVNKVKYRAMLEIEIVAK